MMNLGEMKELFSSYPKDTVLGYGFGDVFSWRGAYDEPCFSIAENITVGDRYSGMNAVCLEPHHELAHR